MSETEIIRNSNNLFSLKLNLINFIAQTRVI